jgi:hypothetical protein
LAAAYQTLASEYTKLKEWYDAISKHTEPRLQAREGDHPDDVDPNRYLYPSNLHIRNAEFNEDPLKLDIDQRTPGVPDR